MRELVLSNKIGEKQGADIYELVLIRFGRLAASLVTSFDPNDAKRVIELLNALRQIGEVVVDNGTILPASTHEEVEVLLRYAEKESVQILEIDGEWSRSIFGAGHVRSSIEKLKLLSEQARYKEDFANSFDNSRHR